MSSLNTDFNTAPYFDDFDEEKRFHRVLFRPSRAVQARELTQSQTILQNQIQRFGDHIFKDGSIVDGVAITYYPNTHYISLADSFNTNTNAFVSDFDNTYLITNSTDSNNAVRAVIKIAKDGNALNAPSTNRIYFDYIATGTNSVSNTDISEFSPGDTLYFYNSSQDKFGSLNSAYLSDSISTLASNGTFTSNGYAYCIGVSDGIIYQKGFFTKVEPQIIAVRDFSTNVAGYVVGFDTTESIVNENIDSSLNDNALGYPNENAPGADRLKLTPTLVSKTRTDAANNINFFSIVEFDNNQPTQQQNDPAYNALNQQISNRTYEESGDYVIRPFQIETIAHESNTQAFYYEVSPGIAYVRGNRIEKIGTSKVETSRAITTSNAQNQIVSANYGNYVICDEFLGSFDYESLAEVLLKDTAQNSFSEKEGITGSGAGTTIGYANVKAVKFYSGTKGVSTAQYAIYLFNIRMNSGYSFSDNVKSIVVADTARADIVLENDKAVLKDSSKTLVFDTGITAIETISDSNFTFNQIKSGSLTTAGAVSITIDASTGGTNQLPYSAGSTLTGSSTDGFSVFVASNTYTANLTGTVAVNSGNTTIIGTSTLFQTQLAVGSLVRIDMGGGNTWVVGVTNISTNTQMIVDTVPGSTNTSSNFKRYFTGGSSLPISNVQISTTSSFVFNTGYTFDASNTVNASYPVYRTVTSPIQKEIRKNRFVTIYCSNNSATSVGPWDLGLSDVAQIRNVYIGTAANTSNPERSYWFTFDNGQRDEYYDHAKLYIKPDYSSQINSSSYILVELDHFVANTTSGLGYFNVNSYPIDDANTANTTAIQTVQIPSYNSIDLRDAIDLRFIKSNTAISTTTFASATVNPVSTNTFTVDVNGQHLFAPDSNFTADFEYYLPRYDLLTLSSIGNFVVQKGEPSQNPRVPFVENDQSTIAQIYVPPYPSITQREAEAYNRRDISSKINLKTNRRYTMKDIGALEERIKRVEYYTVLNTLEQQARDLTIPDANGLNRFKNGIFADPFNSHNLGDVTDFEYKIAIDPIATVARSYFKKHNVDLTFSNTTSSGVNNYGSVVMLNNSSELYISQRFATKYRNACESVWQWNGLIDLYPREDYFKDETVTPNINVNLDLSAPWEDFSNITWGTNYGEWRTVGPSSTTQHVDRNGNIEPFSGTSIRNRNRTTTSSSTQERTVTTISLDTLSQKIDTGSYVQDISVQPYMRSRLVSFVAYNLKPNTTLHAFFDDTNVDAYCAPGILSGTTNPEFGKEDSIVTQKGNFGDALVSDSNGFICGVFKIPASSFRVGDRNFQLVNVDNLTTGVSAVTTKALAIYSASNISVTKGSTSINVTNPTVKHESYVETRTIPPPAPAWNPDDPISQSFRIENLPSDISGVFIKQIGVYFQSKDSSLGCSVFIVEMNNGFPDASKIIGKSYLAASSINTSATAATETVFTLDYPVYLLTSTDYAVVIQPDGNSPNYNVWVGETGGFDVVTNEQVFSNPYSGVLFISANRKTWTAIQKEDLKFNIYRAKFSSTSGTAIFENENDDYLSVTSLNKANSSVTIEVGDMLYSANVYANGTLNSANTSYYGRVQFFDEVNGKIYLDSSTGGFSNTAGTAINPYFAIFRVSDPTNTGLLTDANKIAYGTIQTVDNLTYHAVAPNFGSLQPARTSLSFGYKGTSTSATLIDDASYITVTNGYEYEFLDKERRVLSKSNQTGKSSRYQITLSTESDYVSPVVSLTRKASLYIQNIINNSVTNEHTKYGNSYSKYISKRVVLADGQEAEDLKVYMTAYRPGDTDIKVYAKFRNEEDAESFDDKVWSVLEYSNDSDTKYSSPTDVNDFIEYEFNMPSSNSVAQGAFANTGVDTYNALAGTISIANTSQTITGTGTAFKTNFVVGDTIKIVSSNYTAIRTITNIASDTSLTVDKGMSDLTASNSAAIYYVFSSPGNDGIVEYRNSANSRFIGYKEVALKIVLLSSNAAKVPRLNDVRAICLQI
jgi:hypothetical protein